MNSERQTIIDCVSKIKELGDQGKYVLLFYCLSSKDADEVVITAAEKIGSRAILELVHGLNGLLSSTGLRVRLEVADDDDRN